MPAAIYARVSTADQDCAMQVAELTRWAEREGLEIAGVYADTASGALASRPELDRLLADVRARRVDAVLVWKLDRLGRSLANCVELLGELERRRVRFVATSQGIDLRPGASDPAGRFLLHVLAAAAEFERELIRERVQLGVDRYRREYAAGRARSQSGRNLPVGRQRRVFDRERAASLRAQGWGWKRIGNALGVPVRTLRRTFPGLSIEAAISKYGQAPSRAPAALETHAAAIPMVLTAAWTPRSSTETPCGYCFSRWATSVDHMVPRAFRVDNRPQNLMPACRYCNSILGAKVFDSIDQRRAYVRAWYDRHEKRCQKPGCRTCRQRRREQRS